MSGKKRILDYRQPRWRESRAIEMLSTLFSMIGVPIFCTAMIFLMRFACMRP